jgi:Inner membrane protein YgaP-like, transmembrane domain
MGWIAMKRWQNVGALDRLLRAAVGIVLVALGAFAGLSLGLSVVVWVLAVLLLGTAALGFCPAYLPLGLNTCGTAAGGPSGTPKAA